MTSMIPKVRVASSPGECFSVKLPTVFKLASLVNVPPARQLSGQWFPNHESGHAVRLLASEQRADAAPEYPRHASAKEEYISGQESSARFRSYRTPTGRGRRNCLRQRAANTHGSGGPWTWFRHSCPPGRRQPLPRRPRSGQLGGRAGTPQSRADARLIRYRSCRRTFDLA